MTFLKQKSVKLRKHACPESMPAFLSKLWLDTQDPGIPVQISSQPRPTQEWTTHGSGQHTALCWEIWISQGELINLTPGLCWVRMVLFHLMECVFACAGQGVHVRGHRAPNKAGQSREQEEKEGVSRPGPRIRVHAPRPFNIQPTNPRALRILIQSWPAGY